MKQRVPALVIFLGSFLLFGVQPMLGRTLLPSFGGTAAVWTVCLAAYQTLLLAGYFYAHVICARPLRVQRTAHTVLLGVAVLWTAGFAALRPTLKSVIGNSSVPAFEVLFCVLVFVGLPYVLLSAGSTLVQAWLARSSECGTKDSRGIYRLYAVSNLGSFAGLFVYPFLLEPHVSLSVQWWGLAACLAVYTGLLVWVSQGLARQRTDTGGKGEDTAEVSAGQPTGSQPWLWFVLPAVSVFLLNAVTAHLTLDVMPLPLLWVVLLGLFLLSYVVGFSGKADRYLAAWQILSALSVLAAAWAHRRSGAGGGFALNLSACLALCFFGATFLHTWLYRLRPQAGRLTLYYLGNAAGGAVGGLLASLAAPMVFKRVTEFPVALALVALAGVAYVFFTSGVWKSARVLCLGLTVGALTVFATSVRPKPGDRPVVWRDRGFFGTLQVLEAKAKTATGEGVIREFVHGNTVHGIQVLIPGKERMPTAYYTEQSCGYAVLAHPKFKRGEPLRVCLLGMGVGVMLSYARSNDVYRCYDISNEVLKMATHSELFTFEKDCLGRVEIICQDARKGLERELSTKDALYDVIILDALTGDNIPYHLSTHEAFDLYFKRLNPDGVLAVNISNWHLSLEPLVKAVGTVFECPVLAFASGNDFGRLAFASKTAFFCKDPAKLAQPPKGVSLLNLRLVRNMPLPTDEKGSFVNTIKWK